MKTHIVMIIKLKTERQNTQKKIIFFLTRALCVRRWIFFPTENLENKPTIFSAENQNPPRKNDFFNVGVIF